MGISPEAPLLTTTFFMINIGSVPTLDRQIQMSHFFSLLFHGEIYMIDDEITSFHHVDWSKAKF